MVHRGVAAKSELPKEVLLPEEVSDFLEMLEISVTEERISTDRKTVYLHPNEWELLKSYISGPQVQAINMVSDWWFRKFDRRCQPRT